MGAKRFSFIGEQLVNNGHAVEVLARQIMPDERQDPTLPQPGKVHWVRSILPKRLLGRGLMTRIYNRLMVDVLGMPDPEVGWLPHSILAGYRACKRFQPDVILATGPSFSAFVTATILSRCTGVPLILDYRDPWTVFAWSDDAFGRRMRSPIRRKLEQWAVSSASGAIFVTARMLASFKANHQGRRPELLGVIPNGFSDNIELSAEVLIPDSLNILYAGTIYGQRRISALAQATELLKDYLVSQDLKVAIHIFGELKAEDRERVTALGLSHLIHEHKPVEHRQILGYMRAADVLFLPSGGDVSYALPFKTFDYLSVGRPILAISPRDSELSDLMASVDCGELAEADEPKAIAHALKNLIDRARSYRYSGREQFTWRRLASLYEEAIEQVVNGRDYSGKKKAADNDR